MQKNNLIILVLATFCVGSITALGPHFLTQYFKERSIKQDARRTVEGFCNAFKIDEMSPVDIRFMREVFEIGGTVALCTVPVIGSVLGVTLVGGIASAVCKPLGNLLDEGLARTQVQKGIPFLIRIGTFYKMVEFFKPKFDEANIYLNECSKVFDEKILQQKVKRTVLYGYSY